MSKTSNIKVYRQCRNLMNRHVSIGGFFYTMLTEHFSSTKSTLYVVVFSESCQLGRDLRVPVSYYAF